MRQKLKLKLKVNLKKKLVEDPGKVTMKAVAAVAAVAAAEVIK